MISVNSLELVTLLELVRVKLAFESSPLSISVQFAQPSVPIYILVTFARSKLFFSQSRLRVRKAKNYHFNTAW